MGKNLSQASHIISKKGKQQFNSLIKVLRPKVYITESSTFKKLVQELTGNGSSTTSSPTLLEPLKMAKDFPLIGPEILPRDHPEVTIEASDSTEEATTSSCSSELCCAAMMNEEFNQVCNQICLEDIVLDSQPLDQYLWAYQNLESLLFDVEQNPFFNCYEQIEPELSGLL